MRKSLFLKFIIALSFLFLNSNHSFSQQGEWTWMHGSSVAGSSGNFGVQGIPSPANEPPGVYEGCEWGDPSGNFWIFGGYTAASFYNDLWKYDPVINQWTWIKGPGVINDPGSYGTMGVPSPTNNPPFRACNSSWTDNQGNFWLFGGYPGYSDLWKFDVSTNEWTWIKGPNTSGNPGVYGTQGVPSVTNNPGGRWETSITWTDASGDLWLYGGSSGGDFNDLWRYHIATDEWTWMHGSQTQGLPAVYGTKGIEDPLNTPGARKTYSKWKDLSGNLWLFGGALSFNSVNDLWRYNPLTNNWAWISGSNTAGSPGYYGVKCEGDSMTVPGARWESRTSWTASDGNFWLFGGGANNSINSARNDLWKYCVTQNVWTWVSGDNTIAPSGNWGSLGVSDPLNKPDGRFGSIGGKDNNDNLYMFGGYNAMTGPCNDLWRFVIDATCASCITTPVALFNSINHICPGTCIDFNNLSLNASMYQWTFSGAAPSSSTDVSPTGICYSTPGSYDVELIAYGSTSNDTLLLSNFITVYPTPPPQGIIQNGDTLFANAGAVSYEWYYNGSLIVGASDYYYVASQGGQYNVVATDTNGCEVEAVIFDVVAGLAQFPPDGYRDSSSQFAVYPVPAHDELKIFGIESFRSGEVSIYNMTGEKVMAVSAYELKNRTLKLDVSTLVTGMYWLQIETQENILRGKFLKE